MGNKGQEKKKKSFWYIPILLICIGVFGFSAYQLYGIFNEYAKGDATYAEILSVAQAERTEANDETIEEYQTYVYDFEELATINSEVVAWIRFDQPEIIDYPIVAGEDNDKYLHEDFTGEKSNFGTVFLNMYNSPTFTDMHAILYGHNMRNGSMFGSLDEYDEEEFYKENPYFYIYTPDGKVKKYQIASARTVKDASDIYTVQFADEAAFLAHLDEMAENSIYQTGVPYDQYSQLVTLSTCTVSDANRFVVQGILIEEKEVVK